MADNVVLIPFQKKALQQWAKNNYRGAWFFEPGLGKTFLSLYAMRILTDKKLCSTYKIVVPASIIDMWEDWLIGNGFPKEDMLIVRRGVTQEMVDEVRDKVKIVVTSYNLHASRDLPKAEMVILDESHYVKSHKGAFYKSVRRLVDSSSKVLLLTGTPMPNGIADLYAQIDIISPGLLGKNFYHFRNTWMRKPFAKSFKYVPNKKRLMAFRRLVASVASFQKASRESGMPEVTSRVKKYQYLIEQARILRDLKDDARAPGDVIVDSPAIRMLMMQQMSSGYIDMKIIDPAAPRKVFDIEQGYVKTIDSKELPRVHIKAEIDKMTNKEKMLIDELTNLVTAGKKCLVWVNFTKTGPRLLKLIDENIPALKGKYAVISGSITNKAKNKILDDYQKGKLKGIIAHPAKIGTGLNRFADDTQYLIWYELTTSHALYEQANGRLDRKGQKSHVYMTHYVADGPSIEMAVYNLLQTKGSLKDVIFKGFFNHKEKPRS